MTRHADTPDVPGTRGSGVLTMAMAQPHKGDRRQIKCRVDVSLHGMAQQQATELGVPLSEFLAHALAVLMETPEYDPLAEVLTRREQQMKMTA